MPAGFLTRAQYHSCSPELQQLVRHLCPHVTPDSLHPAVLQRAEAATQRTAWGFAEAERDPDGVVMANKDMAPVGAGEVGAAAAKL